MHYNDISLIGNYTIIPNMNISNRKVRYMTKLKYIELKINI